MWERTSNVPFIWAGPGIAKGVKTDVSVSLIDMYPTLVQMCGLKAPSQMLEGRSLASTLREPSGALDRNIFLPHMNPGEYAIINRDWRYISYGADGDELYHIKHDPNEWENVASEPQYDSVISRLKQSAPQVFAPPEPSLNARKDLVVQGEGFHWERGEGNYKPAPKHLPDAVSNDTSREKSGPPGETDPVRGPGRNQTKNVLLIVCDDLNTHVSPSGYAPIVSPAMDQFASQAITFDRAFCQYPVCGPSRASMLSGLYPESTGILNNTDDIRSQRPNTITMPLWFRQNGFWTGSVGKVFHSPRHEQGEKVWDEFYRFDNDELAVVTKARIEFESMHGSIDEGRNRRKWKTLKKEVSASLNAQTPPGYGKSGLTDAQHKDGKNARQVAKWLTEKSFADKPFFIACGIQKPHVPFLAPDKYFDLYPLEAIEYEPESPELWKSLPKLAISKRYEAFGFQLGVENDQLRRQYMQAYHACISFIDAQIKIILDAVKDSGHWQDTTIILTSDHGYHLGDHFLWGKVTLFDIGAKVPFMIRAPGLTSEGAHSQAMVELVDIFPTLTHLTGLETPEQLQGTSLRPLLGHPERLGKKKFAYSVVTRGSSLGFALRNQRWRYGSWPDGEELYDLTKDPDEKNNLAQLPRSTTQLEEFRVILRDVQNRASAQRRAFPTEPQRAEP